MNVLFQIRKNYLSNIAGDSIVIKNIRKNLMKLGIKVDVYTDCTTDLKKYDVIHIFNTIRVQESYEFMKHAKMCNKKVVLTPIYWDLRSYFKETKQQRKLESWDYSEKKRKFLFDNCDVYLPHCNGEAELISKNYSTSTKYRIVPYGVDERFSMGTKHYLKHRYGIDDYILCVGRMNRQKNQLSLIRALSKAKIPIVLVGSVNDHDYLEECMGAGHGKILLLDKIKSSELNSIYKSAKVHVLPSWVEYPGLATLEAGLAGCNVVTTNVGSTKEVFGELVRYCNPYDIQSIHKETMNAYETNANHLFRTFIMENYTWMKSAQKIKEVYLEMMG